MPSAEQLFADAAWLKRLATTLARDTDDADDLVQESWIAAWQRAPDAGRPMRPWLAKVVRDLAGMRRRSDRRRAAREASAEDAAAPAAPDALVEQMRLHRLVVDLVLELDEPYRSTVIARFVEGRTSASIARSLGIADGTVRKRLHEALARLRAGLDTRSGNRARWAPAVLAFAKGGLHVAKPTKLVFVILTALLLMTGAALVLHAVARSPEPTRAGAAAVAATSEPARPRRVAGEVIAAHVIVAVTDRAGPVADAIVRCTPPNGDVVIAQTAHDGTATVELAAGAWSVAASADGHEPAAAPLSVTAGHDTHVALVLALGGRTLTGVVTDASGGAIAGARIDAARIDAGTRPGRAIAVAFSDASGHYKLTVGGGQLLVGASHAAYAPQSRYVDLGPSGATASFALFPGGVLEGVVRDLRTKEPVAGAAVRASHDGSALELAEVNEHVVMSGGDGKFRIAGLRPDVYEVSAREGERSTRAPVRVGLGVAEQQSDVVVLVAAGPVIRGKVIDEAGAPAAGVTVRVAGANAGEDSAISDDAGGFVLAGLAPRRWMLRGTSERYVAEGHAIVELKANDVEDVVVHVRHGLALAGHVEPREICEVTLAREDRGDPFTFASDESATTNDRGEFRFAPLVAGKATLSARCPNGDEGSLAVVISDDASERVVPVKPGGSIAGRVLDSAGQPVAGVTVSAALAGDHQMTTIVNGAVTSGFQAITATGGAFELRGLAAGKYRLAVLDRGRPMHMKQRAEAVLTTAQHATGVELVVERPVGTIRGTVSGPDGTPIGDAWVALHQTATDLLDAAPPGDEVERVSMRFDGGGGGELPPVLSDARGHFELSNVPHGRYQVIVEAQSGKLRGRAADVTPDAEVAIQLAAVSSLRGTVHGAGGPSALFSVQVTGPTSDLRSFTDGTFELPRVDPGDYTIEVTSSDGTGKATAHVTAGASASVDITLVATAMVTGRLVDKAGKPAAGLTLALVPDQPPGQLKLELHDLPPSSGPDGRFEIEGKPGKMTLVILGHSPMRPGLALEAGKTFDVGTVTLDD